VYIQQAAAQFWNGFDVGTFLAELELALEMVLNAWNQFQVLWKMLLRNERRPGFSFNYAMKHWLEFRYGWRTLIFDMNSAQEAMSNIMVKYRTFTGRSGQDFLYTRINGEVLQTFSNFDVKWRTTDQITVGVRGHYAARTAMRAPKAYFNPLVTGWEIIPIFSLLIGFSTLELSLSRCPRAF
jgi:hypothetical protein